MAFDLDPDYKQVPERIADFKAKHPEGSLRPLNPERPYEIVSVEGQTFIVYSAAAFRHPLDPAPGVGQGLVDGLTVGTLEPVLHVPDLLGDRRYLTLAHPGLLLKASPRAGRALSY